MEELVLPSAAVVTDRPDYALGQSAMITASGFAAGEAVRFQVLHTDGTPNTSADNAPWTVTDGGAGDLDGVANGTIQTSWGVSNPNDVGSSFQLTATGLSSGRTSQAAFTDTFAINLVQNPGFETGDFTNWTLSGNTGFTSVTTDKPHSGSYAAHLGPIGSLGFITQSQQVSTIAGGQYTFSWWLANDDPGTPSEFVASWNGTTVLDQVDVPPQAYKLYSYTVNATSASTPLQFGFRQDPAWLDLDDVSVTFIGMTNTPPVLTSPGNRTVNEQSPLAFGLTANDADGDPLTYSIVSGAQTGMSLTSDGHFSWTPSEVQDGVYPITFGVSDGRGGTDQKSINITVNEVNTAPSLNVPASLGVIKTTPVNFTAMASDPDTINPGAVPNTLTYSLVGNSYGATIDPNTGVFHWTPTQDQDGPFNFTVEVTDKGSFGLPDSQALATDQTVTITTAPAGIDANGNLLVVGHSTADTIVVDATNPAAAAVTIDGTPFGPFAIPAGGHIVVHAYDGGNTITILGGVAATITAGNGNNTISGGAGNDTISAGSGNNAIVGGGGSDSITAGNGNNTVTVNGNSAGTVTLTLGTGANSLFVNTGATNDTVAVSNTQVTVTGGATVNFANIQALSINTGAGADNIAVEGLTLTGGLTLNGGDDVDTATLGNVAAGQVNVTAEGITLDGPVTTSGSQTYSAWSQGFTQGGAIVTASGGADAVAITVGGGGNASIQAITTGAGGKVSITAGGSITTGNPAAVNISTNNIALSAGAGIGTPVAPIKTVTIVTGPTSTMTVMTFGGTGGVYLVNSGSLTVAGSQSADSAVITAQSPLTVTGNVTSTGGTVTLTASGGPLTVAPATTISTGGGGDVDLVAGSLAIDKTASLQTTGSVGLDAASASLAGIQLGKSSKLSFTKDSANIDLGGADFGTLVNQGSSTTIALNGADFSTLTNSGAATTIFLNGADFSTLTNSAASTTINLNGAAFANISNSGDAVHFNVDHPTGATGADFSSFTNSGSNIIVNLNGADFSSLVNLGAGAVINLNGADFSSLVNSAAGTSISLNGADFKSLINGDANQVANIIALNGADFSTLTNVGSGTTIALNGADFQTLINAGSATTINLNGADFQTLINGGAASGTTINLNGANFESLFTWSTISVNGSGSQTAANGVVQVNLTDADFQTLVSSGTGTTVNVNGADFASLLNQASGTTINLNGADFNSLISSGSATTIYVNGADFNSMQTTGASTVININGADFQTLVNSGTGTAININGSSFQYVENDGDNTTIVASSGFAGSSTLANNGNNSIVTYTGGSGADVFVNDAQGDTSHGNNVALSVNLGDGDNRYVLGGTAVTGAVFGGSGNNTYTYVGGLTGNLSVQQPTSTATDTLDFSHLTTGPVNIDLNSVQAQSVAPGLSLKLYSGTAISNVIGTKFGDTIRGNSRNDVLLGANLPDDRVGTGPAQNGRMQVVFLDFNHPTVAGYHDYTQAERDAIQKRLELDYYGPSPTDPTQPNYANPWFQVKFTQTQPSGVQNQDYVTEYFNQVAPDTSEGPPGLGGDSSEIDFGNRNLGGWATIVIQMTDPVTNQLESLVGGQGQPPPYNSSNTSDQSWQNDNSVRASAWIAAHELAHLFGVQHPNSFGPIGYGYHAPPGINGFVISPPYNGPTAAFETDFHLIAAPQLTGFTLNDLVADTFFGEREAVILSYDNEAPTTPDGKLLVNEQAGDHSGLTPVGSQQLNLMPLTVPNTLTRGLNSDQQFSVAAEDVLASISAVGQKDSYSLTGRKGDLINVQVMSDALSRYTGHKIDAVLNVYDSLNTLVPIATSDNDSESHDPNLVDFYLPHDGTYYFVVTAFATTDPGLSTTGQYELFAYRFSTYNPTDGNDTLIAGTGGATLAGGMGNNTLVGGAGNDTFVFQNRPAGTAGTDTVTGGGGIDTLDYSRVTAGVTVDLSNHTTVQSVGGGNSLFLPAEDVENVAGSATAPNTLTGNSLSNILIGGALNDTLVAGGGGNDILIGNAGDDMLVGGPGNDILIGGTGGDRIVASAGNDIMIAGSTDYDFLGYDPAKAQILTNILAEWNNSAEAIGVRQAAIAGKPVNSSLNGGYYLNASTVHSDTSVDKLTGSSGFNWFFVDDTAAVSVDNTPIDTITGNTKNAFFTYID
jgi:Ca2+-binding RTX toxin-like protein